VSRPSVTERAPLTVAIAPGGHFLDPMVWLLLIVAFFVGPLKLLGASWLAYLVPDSLAALVLLLVVCERTVVRKPLFALSGLTLPLVFLGAYCVLEMLNPEAPPIRSLIGLRSWLLYTAFYFVGLYTFRSVRQIERLYALLLGLGVVTGLYGVYQWKVGPQAFASWSEYYGEYAKIAWSGRTGLVFRAFSTFVAAGTFAGNMGLVAMLAFSVVASETVPRRWRFAAVGAFVAAGAGIVVSGSRGPVVHLVLAGVVAFMLLPGFRSRLRGGIAAGVSVGLVLFVVALQIGSFVGQRFQTIFDPENFFWKWFGPLMSGFQVAAAHPIGVGLGYTAGVPRFVSAQLLRDLPTINIDSGYGSAAAELGFLGLLLFGYLAVKVGIEGVRAWKRLPPGRTRDLLLGPALFAATYPILSVIAQPQATLPSSIYFWLLIGMLMRASQVCGEGRAHRVRRPEMYSG